MDNISELLKRKLSEGREFRDMEIRALDGEENDQMIVEGYATTFNQFYELWKEPGYTFLEQVDAKAFDGCDMSDVIMQYDHEGRVFARMSNGTLTATPDEVGLRTRADLSGTEIGRQLYQEIKGGYTNKMSFAFKVGEDRREIEENRENGEITVKRTITRISRLYDVSAVSLPANPATSISARNFSEGVIAEIKAERQRADEREKRIRRLELRIKLSKGESNGN